MLTGHKHYSIT